METCGFESGALIGYGKTDFIRRHHGNVRANPVYTGMFQHVHHELPDGLKNQDGFIFREREMFSVHAEFHGQVILFHILVQSFFRIKSVIPVDDDIRKTSDVMR